ncbi:hypothetical protein BH10PSE2_BH10PSE2_29030 [soil metagenome]
MRRLLPLAPRVRSLLIHFGQSLGLLAIAGLAMAAAPAASSSGPVVGVIAAVPAAPPVLAKVEKPGPVTRTIIFVDPVPGRPITSKFGLRKLSIEPGARQHKGVDIAAPTGTSVFGASEGVVLRIGYDPEGYGNFIEMRHPNGMTTLYGHLSRVDVASGDRIAANQRIGLVGTTGYSTGPHLHFEIRRDGGQVNPAKVLGRVFQVKAG